MREAFKEYQVLANNLSSMTRQIALEANPVKLLSDSDDKKVELVEDKKGHRFIRRSYDTNGVRYVERSGLRFTEAWEKLNREFDNVGLSIVPSFIVSPFDQPNGYPTAIIAEYLENSEPVLFASIEAKKKFALSLGSMIHRAIEVLPSPKLLRPDSFRAVHAKDGDQIFLVDIDPDVIVKKEAYYTEEARDISQARYMDAFADFISNDLCEESEVQDIMSEFVKSVTPIAITDSCLELTREAYARAHLMSRGISPLHF